MLTTSLSSVLFAAMAAAGLTPSTAGTTWQTDYSTAARIAAESKKPMAVFIGQGKTGHTSLVTDGLGEAETKALSTSYVCLYIDAGTESGKKLATTFELTEGIVISDRSGNLQAVRHEGPVTKSELNEYLKRYSEPTRIVTTTEYGGRARRPIINTIQNVTGFLSGSS
jgi:hypothetical protein